MLNTSHLTFAGHLAADPQLRFTPSGKAVADFRVLVNRSTKNADGEYVDAEPTSHDCVVWEQVAENLAESATSGDRVIVHGRIYTETWVDEKTGEKRYRDKVRVDEIGLSLVRKPAKRI